MDLKQTIRALCNRVLLEKETLTHLDQAVGDGDFGTNMERGALAILSLLDRLDERIQEKSLLLDVGKTLNAAGCGTAGTLLSFGIMAGALRGQTLSTFCGAALIRIQASGKAQLGEKTMVDALEPAVQVLGSGGSLEEAAKAAQQGAENTRDMLGTKGRSLYSQTRAKGIPDPGAYLVAALFDEAAHVKEGHNNEEDH
jgi:dihydroxyacetone kinase